MFRTLFDKECMDPLVGGNLILCIIRMAYFCDKVYQRWDFKGGAHIRRAAVTEVW